MVALSPRGIVVGCDSVAFVITEEVEDVEKVVERLKVVADEDAIPSPKATKSPTPWELLEVVSTEDAEAVNERANDVDN